jgi:hypothetical protein
VTPRHLLPRPPPTIRVLSDVLLVWMKSEKVSVSLWIGVYACNRGMCTRFLLGHGAGRIDNSKAPELFIFLTPTLFLCDGVHFDGVLFDGVPVLPPRAVEIFLRSYLSPRSIRRIGIRISMTSGPGYNILAQRVKVAAPR